MKIKNENLFLVPSKIKGEKKINITLRNELTIYSIEGLKDKIVDAIKDYDQIIFDIKDVKNMDLSFVQLLYSVKITADTLNKKVSFNVNLSDDIKTLFTNSDLSKVLI
jgi:anti-anti-sigma regulatory factor